MQPDAAFEERFLSGRELYGDDFAPDSVARWFADEEHGYAELYGSDRERHAYGYTALNEYHGFAHLAPTRRFRHVLGFGSNFGDELLPILGQADRVTLLDASDRYVVSRLKDVPVRYLLAQRNGRIALEAGSVDLVTCFGVLHHIPNVSTVLREIGRVLAPGGVLLVREPTTSMGDWRLPRVGLTARERGIPRDLFLALIARSGFIVERSNPCYFPPWVRLCERLGMATFSSWGLTAVDGLLSRLFAPFWSYHRRSLIVKFAPASLFVTARRTDAAVASPSSPPNPA